MDEVTQEESAPDKPHKRGIIALTLTLILLAAVYVALGVFFTGHFGFNTTIDGVNVSMKTADEAEQAIQDHVDSYALEIVLKDGDKQTLSGSDINLDYRPGDRIQSALEDQNSWLWPQRLIGQQEPVEIGSAVMFDASALQDLVTAMPFMDPSAQIPPADAQIVFDKEKDEYVVVAESYGSVIDTDAVYTKIAEAVRKLQSAINLDEAGCYLKPSVSEDNAALQAKAEGCNKYIKAGITYVFSDEIVPVSREEEMNWVKVAADGTASLDKAAIKDFVAELAKEHDTIGTPRSFTTHDGQTIQVTNGTYGWKINQDKEVSQILSDLEAGEDVTREPIFGYTGNRSDAGDWGTTYVEVSIEDQHMWYYVDGEQVFESDVVTGLPVEKRETCTGAYSVFEKLSPTVLKGPEDEDGEPEWESDVRYWMRITWSGTGFHDASWRSKFGGDIYKNGGSHGCINMPYEKAEELYDIINLGTPVIIYNGTKA